MKTLVVFGILGGILLSVVFGYIGFTNNANRYEVTIKAQYTDNKNVYDNGWKTVQEKAQVPELYTAQLKELYDNAMTGRYGEDGSKALFQFIKEQNPTLDSKLFIQIQQSVETFRNRFQQAQTELVSKKQAYESYLTATTSGRFYNMFASYPHIDMSKFDIVTSDKTETDFSTKRAEPLDLSKKK